MRCVPVSIVARNEERAIGPCLDSVIAAKAYAEQRLPLVYALAVVLDDCTDGTERAAQARGIPCLRSTGGKVEAQRRGVRPGPFQVFCDADVLVPEDALHAVSSALEADQAIAVAFPPKAPLPARSRSPLAWALHVYNARRGFSSERGWFSGKFFAIRRWEMPTAEEIAHRAAALPASRFYAYGEPLRVDDIYLSRRAGAAALCETRSEPIRFRAPETAQGMYRYYRRLRRELERTDALFPDLPRGAPRHPDLLRGVPRLDRLAWILFLGALIGCRAVYVAERLYRDRLSSSAWEAWPSIPETKEL